MIVGLGIDVVEVSRIEDAMCNPRFISKILTSRERELPMTASRVAGRWAAKEAIAKALTLKLTWQDVEILPDADGKPIAEVRGLPAGCNIHISISHERGNAAAVAIVEKLD